MTDKTLEATQAVEIVVVRRRDGGAGTGDDRFRWPAGTAPGYRIEASDDRRRWHTLRRVTQGDGGSDPIELSDTETCYLRISGAKGLTVVEMKDRARAEAPNAFVADLARNARRGPFPHGLPNKATGPSSPATAVRSAG